MARRTTYGLMGAGLYGLNGLSPVTSKHLIDIYIMPRMTYGLEALPVSTTELAPMEIYFRELLRMIQHLPPSTANAACYMLIGAIPAEATAHIKTLNLLGSILHNRQSLEFEILERIIHPTAGQYTPENS